MKDFVFSIKKITTFNGEEWFYPMYKDDGILGSWNVIFQVNGRTLTYLPNFNVDKDTTYACLTKEIAESFIQGYREVLKSKLDKEIQKEEIIEIETNTNLTEQNEN